MLRPVFTLLLLSVLLCASCETTPPALPVRFQRVFDADGTQSVVFARTVDWVSKYLSVWQGNILRHDADAGILTAHVILSKKPTGGALLVFGDRRTLDCYAKFEVKDNRVRVTFDNFVVVTHVRETGGLYKDTRDPLEAGKGAEEIKAELLNPWVDEYQKLIATPEKDTAETDKPF